MTYFILRIKHILKDLSNVLNHTGFLLLRKRKRTIFLTTKYIFIKLLLKR